MKNISRRGFVKAAVTTAITTVAFPHVRAVESVLLGQGGFKYRVVPDWGVLGAATPVNNCHGLVCDREGHIILLTDDVRNNVIVYDRKGKLQHKWGTAFPGAHGLSIVEEGRRQILFITDLNTHKVVKTTLDGMVLQEWGWPKDSGKYMKEEDYRPSWTLHLPSGDFFILDGYGRDYIQHIGADGKLRKIFGGAEGGIAHWGPHGGMVDAKGAAESTLLVAMSDQQHLLRLSLDGQKLGQINLPGGNPRQIRRHKKHYFVAHLGDNWPKDRNCRGFVSVLDAQFRVVSNVAGTAPAYGENGQLQPMRHEGETFHHPHDLIVDDEDSLYVAQFASGRTYPIKLERV